METNTFNNSYTGDKNPKKNKTALILLIVVAFLFIVAGILGWRAYQLKQDSDFLKLVQLELESRTDSLSNELAILFYDYEELKTDNDSMNLKLEEQQTRIKQLLSINASNFEKIRLYEKELGTLREIMKSYIVQIDSLNQRNILLTAENIEVRSQLEREKSTTRELSEEREQLTSKVELASVLSAKDIIPEGLNRRSRETDRIRRIEKFRVCFTVRENAIVPPGPKTIYLRISRPDNVALASSVNNILDLSDEQIIYTEKRELVYENTDIDICIYYDVKEGELIPGTYKAELFAEGNSIGYSTFALKD